MNTQKSFLTAVFFFFTLALVMLSGIKAFAQTNRNWATYYGGTGFDAGYSIATDPFGNVYLTGSTLSTGMASGGFQNVSGGGTDAYLVKFDSNGNRLWATYYGGPGTDLGMYVATDVVGNVYLSGRTGSASGIASGGFQNTFGGGGLDAFLVKFDMAGNRLWATYYGGTGDEHGYSVATDPAGNVFLGGYTDSPTNIASGGFQNIFGGGPNDAFLVKFDGATGARFWATYYGSGEFDQGFSVATDGSGNVYLAGWTYFSGFSNPTYLASGGYQNTINVTGGAGQDMFLVKFNGSGARLWGTYYGGTMDEFGGSVTVDGSGNVFIAGRSNSSADVASPGAFQFVYAGGSDAFLVKFNSSGSRLWATYYGDAGLEEHGWDGLATDPSGNVFMAGDTYSPGTAMASNGFQSSKVGLENEFLVKFDPAGSRLCATYYGGNHDEDGLVTVDGAGNVYLGGSCNSLTGIASGGFQNTYGGGGYDGYIVQFATCIPVSTLSATSSSTNVTCNAACNGTASVTASGGTPPYTYAWTPSGGNAANASGLCASNYTCTITDNLGATVTQSFAITQPTAVTATQSQTNLSCNAVCNGSASVVASGGTPGYTYAWSPSGGNAANASGLCANNYTCTITDANGCPITGTFSITQPPAITASASSTQSACTSNTGTATTTASGGTGTLTYNWLPSGGTNATANNLAAGNYTCTITDANGCTQTATTTVTTVNGPSATLQSQSNVTCNGGNDGTATVNPSGGTPGYTYSWSPSGGTAITGTGLSNGNYTCTITDAAGCAVTQTVAITEPSAISASATSTPAGCSANTGTATTTASGGTGTLTYSWFPSGGTNATANNLFAGNYVCTITDANGCIQTVGITVGGGLNPTVTLQSQTDVLCNGGNTGTATVNPSGGTPGYTYLWSPIGGTAITGTGLTAGNYTCTITDAAGCFTTQTVLITEPPVISASATSTNATCGNNDGTATTTASGGAGTLTYSWAPSGGTNAIANNLSAGNYTCTITDANGCTSTVFASVASIGGPTTSVQSFSDVLCNGGSTGSGTIGATGSGPFTYAWSSSGGNAASATGLAAGSYSVTVTDTNNCVTIQTLTITEPTQLFSNPTSTPATCGNNNGTADAVASGGTGPYIYLWSNSLTTATLSNLAGGTYSVDVTDANGCTTTSTVVVTSTAAPVVTLQSSSNVTCFGGTNGAATMDATGGSSPYTYSWSPSGGTNVSATGLSAGTYTITVTASDGCIQTQTVTLTQPTAIAMTGNSVPENCSDGDGSAWVSASGGTPGYTYVWSNASTNDTISNLVAGFYSVTATDANGCTFSSTVTVASTGIAIADAGASVTITSGQTTQLSGTGGVTYSWSPPTDLSCSNCQNPIASPTVTTTYTLTVTDANGCTDTDTVTIFVDIACGEIYLPNAFSPNTDGQNEVLYVRGNCVQYLDFKIYNRWGEQVFYTTDISKGWDGTWRGKACEAAVFTYVLRATLLDGTEINKQGNISLVK